ATLTTPALNRRSLRWFGLPTCIGEPGGPNLHHRHSTVRAGDLLHRLHSPFRTHRISADVALTCTHALAPRRTRHLDLVTLDHEVSRCLRCTKGPCPARQGDSFCEEVQCAPLP